jgi:UDP-GlcNAc3NAcA epimerase
VVKIVTILGARPQFIKAGSISRELLRRKAAGFEVEEVIVHTGQHYDSNMSDIFFNQLGIPAPRYHLGIGSGLHGKQTGKMLEAIEEVLIEETPDCVLVYGDTNSTLAGALAASKMSIPIAHVEAGLRSFNKSMPEEQNRIVTDHLSDLLFSPTDVATRNLRNEGIAQNNIHQAGDVMFDVSLIYGEQARNDKSFLKTLGVEPGAYILATVHRASNTDDPESLKSIVSGLEMVAKETPVVLPLHPRTQKAMQDNKLSFENVQVVEPVGYFEMVVLECQAALVVTDSGGVQKEAYFHGVPCVTLRDDTEWVELIEMGWNRLARPRKDDIANVIRQALGTTGGEGQPYGDGDASRKIAGIICNAC